MENIEHLTPIRFHFYKLNFTPYKDATHTSNSILKEVITYIMQEKAKGKGHLIDRHESRNDESRELFMNTALIMAKEKRIRCSLALLRAGKTPMLKPADKFKLVRLDTTQGSIAEQTHFYIDYNKDYAVICLEFNSHGPRISDVEYYLRNIAHDTLKISKATEVGLIMDVSVDKALASLKNVLNLEIKVQPKKLAKLETDLNGRYFTSINNLGNFLKPKFLKLEAMYQTPGNTVKSSQLNLEANGMVKTMLERMKKQPQNIDVFDSFVVKYEDKDGNEETLNLLKGKKEIIKHIDVKSKTTAREWYEIIEKDFDEFMETL
ncbi:MAG TPA: hypothetical protein VK177_21235 [Flavobacteriales bacterium]|nr:hypothetical protein [Flavobacteriales bacterium]